MEGGIDWGVVGRKRWEEGGFKGVEVDAGKTETFVVQIPAEIYVDDARTAGMVRRWQHLTPVA